MRRLPVSAAVFVAALGGVVHNALSLPLPLLAPETTLPALIYALLLAWVIVARGAAAAHTSLLAWAVLNLIGGVLSVLSQLPLIAVTGAPVSAATTALR